jgi:hypothetical protein
MRCCILKPALRIVFSILVGSTALSRAAVSAQSPISESQVKAAYLYNFAKFIAWPDQSFGGGNAPLEICVLNDSSFESTLKGIVSLRSIDNHPVQVVHIDTSANIHSCHILFIRSALNRDTRGMIESLRNSGIVTVGEADGFLEEGGIIRFALQDGRVQFQVNLKAATEAGLHISSRLLSVATRVIQ